MEPQESHMASLQPEAKGPTPPENYLEVGLDDPILCLRTRFWWFLILSLQSFLLILQTSCLSTPKWIKQGSGSYQWEGGVVTCTTCDLLLFCTACDGFDNEDYNSLQDSGSCDQSSAHKSLCSAFEDLASAGAAYFFFEMLAYAFLIVWMVKVILMLLEKPCCEKLRFLGYVYSVLPFISHLLGLVIWAGISEAKFDADDCDSTELDGSKPTLCATHGPALAVFTVFVYAISVGVFIFAYVKSAPTALNKEPKEKGAGERIDKPEVKGGAGSPRQAGGFSPVHQGGDVEMHFQPESRI